MTNRLLAISLLVLVALALLPGRVAAQTKTCDALRGAQREVAQAVLSSQHPYDCCDATIATCLRKKPVCKLVERLADDICRRAAAGKSRPEIERELERRAASTIGQQAPHRSRRRRGRGRAGSQGDDRRLRVRPLPVLRSPGAGAPPERHLGPPQGQGQALSQALPDSQPSALHDGGHGVDGRAEARPVLGHGALPLLELRPLRPGQAARLCGQRGTRPGAIPRVAR